MCTCKGESSVKSERSYFMHDPLKRIIVNTSIETVINQQVRTGWTAIFSSKPCVSSGMDLINKTNNAKL